MLRLIYKDGGFMNENYIVYVRTDSSARIIDVNSSAFVSDLTGWDKIDEGTGDKYHHAQGNYFTLPLYDERGCSNYKLVNGKPQLRTSEEKAQEIAARPSPEPSQIDRIEAQSTYTAMMTDTLLEV